MIALKICKTYKIENKRPFIFIALKYLYNYKNKKQRINKTQNVNYIVKSKIVIS